MNNGSINDIDSRLAFDLATRMTDTADVLRRYSLTPEGLKRKLENPAFAKIYTEAKAIWNSDLSIKERIRLKAQAIVEDSLLEMYTILTDTDRNTTARIEAFKTLTRVANVDTAEARGVEAGSRVNIVLNIPGAGQISGAHLTPPPLLTGTDD